MTHDSTQLPSALRARLLDAPLWEFALALYGRDGVEAACLMLQDEAGIDVCELLWHCWLHHHGLACDACLDPVRRWQRQVTAPLRRLRRELKPEAGRHASVAALRRTLQQAELQAEREALSRLERLALEDERLSALPSSSPCLAERLAMRLQVQKKPHLSALKTLESQLDPS
ncbi:TIGR02444 family protein [Halomonas sp. LR5S13]|uniref:TIGR02444 family protein n=1 Tax=Halomonas rhizosphaerae TaxID=3043296 RepID=UPI0024A9E020|nr:TIGR02444 family protein [Halomonas rhizosphaerae]MDI5919423.1 TIGR02444 family protein [Halomonas rhizosphaerae]